jgi:hypothetical protein
MTLGVEGALVLGGFIAELDPRDAVTGLLWGAALLALLRAVFLYPPSDFALHGAAGLARLPRGGCLCAAIGTGQLTSFP